MNVTIVGTGNMARGIATRIAAGGHGVTVVGRNAEKAAALARQIHEGASRAQVSSAALGDGLPGEVVVLALPYAGALDFAKTNADGLKGKTVIDITNPLNATYDGLVTAPGSSAAEELAALLPESRIVKAFNTVFAGTLLSGVVHGEPLDVLVAANDESAKADVLRLVKDGGVRALDVGRLERARTLEGLALITIGLQGPLGLGFQSAWKLTA